MLLRSLSFMLLCLAASAFGQKSDPARVNNLNAAISASRPENADKPSLTLDFVLRNDSDLPAHTDQETWTFLIDGKDADPGGMLFGNGLSVGNGGTDLEAGETFEKNFVVAIARYFPERRDYRLLWKGKHFTSNVLVVRGGVTPRPQPDTSR